MKTSSAWDFGKQINFATEVSLQVAKQQSGLTKKSLLRVSSG